MNNNVGFHKWLVQLRKGFLELCVLIILRNKGKSYGFELLRLFKQAELDIDEGTLYPLLNRMHKNGWLESSWETPTTSGHPRRFYSLSTDGERQLPDMLAAHRQHTRMLKCLEEAS